MAILNYTTSIDAFKTVSEIEFILVKHGAKSIVKDFVGEHITSLSFLVDTGETLLPIRLPAKTEECFKVLQEQKKNSPKSNIKATPEQAERVAWRILKTWVEAQMALLDIKMAETAEVFMPYIVDRDGKTLYEKLEERKFLLEG